jgi:eukaryotic-like serine/threonine-protein kinase
VPVPSSPPRVIGRYLLFDEIASGGMATVHYGRMTGQAGFARTVAIKRLHPQFAKAPEFVAMLIDEARLAARIRHPNVVSMLDVVTMEDETLLVMEYVQGLTVSHLVRQMGQARVPLEVAVAIMSGALDGLHAAHEACGEDGAPLGIVHRDVSPQNILVGSDGVPRVTDFGIAKAAGRLQTTRDGQIKGKTAYMAPEQIRAREVDRRTDVYAASVVLWELLTGQRLFNADSAAGIMNAILEKEVPPASAIRGEAPSSLDEVVSKGMSRDPAERFATAREMAVALERALRPASAREVGDWVAAAARSVLEKRARKVADMEAMSSEGSKIIEGVVADVLVSRDGAEPQTTSSSVVSDKVAPRRRRSAMRALLALVALGVVGAVATFTGLRWRGGQSSSGNSEETAGGTVSAISSSSVLQGGDAASVAAPASVAPPASATTDAPSSGPVAPPRHRTRPVPAPAAPHVDCNPPYEIDAHGARHWKNGC